MIEKNNSQSGGLLGGLCGRQEQPCCVTVNKIFDSAKDKDCLEDLRVHLCDRAQEVVDRATAVRCTDLEVLQTNITIDTVPFNRGFYQVTIRFFFCVTLECCVCGGRSQCVTGLCAFDKKVILYGSEKNVAIFRSDPESDGFCVDPGQLSCNRDSTLPSVTVEVASPICLDVKVVERCRPFGHCCMTADSIPENIRGRFDGEFAEGIGTSNVYISIGLFTVTRMERPVQLILPASRFYLPDRDSTPAHDSSDPCSVFGKLNFPLCEFFPYADERGCCGSGNGSGGGGSGGNGNCKGDR